MKKMSNMWNQRYNTEAFVYGREPNVFFARSLESLAPGKILLPGEGAGRNAIYAAGLGWKVDAFDQSSVAAQKALGFAREKEVQISYRVNEVQEFPFEEGLYDVVGLVYFHAPPPVRKLLHSRVMETLKPGGMVILEAFHTSQLGRDSGGPQVLDLLFSKEILQEDFAGLEFQELEECEVQLDEGLFHGGPAKVIRFRGIKKLKT
jgi:2-polyprenyl-3-methyl-5-hydroxy-6-metoxy-1,4-benzoquinol methylase